MVFRLGENRVLEIELVKLLWKHAAQDFVPLRFNSNFAMKGDHAPSFYADAYLLDRDWETPFTHLLRFLSFPQVTLRLSS